MNNHATATGITAGAVVSLLAVTIGLPLLAATAITDPVHSEAEPGGLITEGIPPVAAEAYLRAAATARTFTPPCEIPAWILAGVGEIETRHGTHAGATLTPNGDVEPPLIGPPLPHLGGDTDNGLWDGSSSIDHAVGPMQFLPATWRIHGRDGNHDGYADPHNLFDAALAAAAYLCHAASPMADENDWRRGLYAYNHSRDYVDLVLDAAHRYRSPTAVPGASAGGPPLVVVPGIGPTNAIWAAQVQAMLTAAAADGITLTGSSYRTREQQIALRRAHCGTSHYDIHDMPASRCNPPTARPGTSNHEQGLAIDFHNCSTRTSPCHRWLTANAPGYGIYPLRSEPWHWSTNGQ